MKTFTYLILAIIGLTGTITGTIKLCSLDANVMPTFAYTLFSVGLFVLFGYAFYIHIKDLK